MIRREITGRLSALELSHMLGQVQGAPTIRKGPTRIEGPDFMNKDQPIEYFEPVLIVMSEECWFDIYKDNNAIIHGLSDFHHKGPITFQGILIAVTKSYQHNEKKWIQFHE